MPEKTHGTSCGAAASFSRPDFDTWLNCARAVIAEVALAPPTLPGFYPHSEWAAVGPVHAGVRFHVPGPSLLTDLGC